jgi:hypothetical protein
LFLITHWRLISLCFSIYAFFAICLNLGSFCSLKYFLFTLNWNFLCINN